MQGKIQHIRASLFEITRDTAPSSENSKQQLCGYVSSEDDAAAFNALKELCSKDTVDKIIIVYHDYAFSLVGVSFTESNANPPSIRLGTTCKFRANDIQLERISESDRREI